MPKKYNVYKRDTKNFDRENFILDMLNIDWHSVTELHKGDPNHSFNTFQANINSVFDKYATKKTVKEKKLNNNISIGIRKSIKRRGYLYKYFIKARNIGIKEEYQRRYKELRNQIVILCR